MTSPRSDADVRQLIRWSLDESLLVEAAAGTGKTTELVERMVNVLASGRASIQQVVAVTFTDKAAGELKLRLRERLEAERQDGADAQRRARAEQALAGLETAHVSTIHGFCADLLRERPVEAGVDPAFEVLLEGAAERLHARVFDAWLERALNAQPETLRRALLRPEAGPATPVEDEDDDPVQRLRRCAWELASWRDFPAPWRRPASFRREEAVQHAIDRVRAYAALTVSPARKGDQLARDARAVLGLVADLDAGRIATTDLDTLEARLVDLSRDRSLCRKGSTGTGDFAPGVSRASVVGTRDALVTCLRSFAVTAEADLASSLQEMLSEVTRLYEAEKARSGRLDFLDLLLRARDLLREHPDVRAEFAGRFTRIFVDEFQDTDPIQAEVLLLLAADGATVSTDGGQRTTGAALDWRTARPRPGALFLVGDPRQAIYRFRRADPGTYRDVARQLARCGIQTHALTTSFRSAPNIQCFVNDAFRPVMQNDDRAQQWDYVPLCPFRPEQATQPSVVALPVPRPYSSSTPRLSGPEIEKSLPAAVGAFVHWLLTASGWTVTEQTSRSGVERRVEIAARHVCILFRRFDAYGKPGTRRDVTRPYVEALDARGVSHLLVGGRSFHAREEIETLTAALSAIEHPDDELSVYATLRGSLFAIPDATLLAYRERAGRFQPFNQAGAGEHGLAEVVDALGVLRRLHLDRQRVPIAATIAALLEATRAHAGLALRPSGEQALANVLHLAELARDFEMTGGLSFRGFVRALQNGEFNQVSEAPILEEGADGVRLMTVHRAKGLEFPVVVLADLTAQAYRRQASRHLDPSSGSCVIPLLGCAPEELHEHEPQELARESAEAIRVAYVAATRARDLLVVPAVGDAPYEDRWLSVLNSALYPEVAKRREAQPAPGCPPFGSDSVLVRPMEDPPLACTVSPGAHRVGGSSGDRCTVVWWDPFVLPLEAQPSFGLRQAELIGKHGDEAQLAADLAAFRSWERARAETLEAGARPSMRTGRVKTRAFRGTPPIVPADHVPVVRVGTPDPSRPQGPRYGTLVHEVLSLIPLDASPDQIARTSELRGLVLGATRDEVRSAAEVARAVLEHEVLARARRAEARGRCRREAPITLLDEDGTLLEGQVDLAFEEGGEWHVVDFKTDREIGGALDRYRLQVAMYVEAVATATGRPAHGLLVQI